MGVRTPFDFAGAYLDGILTSGKYSKRFENGPVAPFQFLHCTDGLKGS